MKHLPLFLIALAMVGAGRGTPAMAADASAAAQEVASAASAASSAAAASAPALTASAPAEPTPLERQLKRIRDLRLERPGDGLLVYYESLTLASMGQAESAVAALKPLEGRRLGLVPTQGTGFEQVWENPDFQALRRRLMDDEPATDQAPVVLRLKDARLIPEGIAYDARRKAHYLGSIAQRKVITVNARGEVSDFSKSADNLEAVLGLAVDAPRDRLCAVSTNGFELAARQQRRNEVVCWSLAKGRVIQRVAVPDALQLNDLAFGRDGTLFATDSAAGSLWVLRPGERRFMRVGEAGGLRGANGVAISPDGSVYVTLSTGIARVNALTGHMTRLPQPDDVATGGIDGLYWHEGDLVGIQNVTNPGRVVRIALTEDGQRIRGLTVLQSHHHPAFNEPTTGVIVGDALHVIANSYVGAYQPDGTIQDEQLLQPTVVLAVPLRLAGDAAASEPRGAQQRAQ